MTAFTFEASVYRDDTEPVFELRMRYQGRIIWSDKTPVDFGAQHTDDPYEPSTPLTGDDLTWALRRAGWRKLGDWDDDATDPGTCRRRSPRPISPSRMSASPRQSWRGCRDR